MGPDRLDEAERLLEQGRPEDLPAVIAVLRGHLQALPPGDEDRSRVANNLAFAEVAHHNATARTVDDTRRLARALEDLLSELADTTRVQVTLGGVHERLWADTHELAEALAARGAYREGLDGLDADDPLRHSIALSLANLGMQIDDVARDRDDRAALAEETVGYAELALATVSPEDGSAGRAECEYNLACALRLRDLRSGREGDLTRALELLAQAEPHAGPLLAAMIPNVQGLCHKSLDRAHRRPGALDAEIEACARAWDRRTHAPPESREVVYPRNLANSLAERCRRGGGESADAARALALYRASAEHAARSFPWQAEMTVGNWMVFATEQEAWDDVIEAGELGLATIRELGRRQADIAGRGSFAFPKRSIVAFLVRAHLARDGDVLSAGAAAERGRGWLLGPDDPGDARRALTEAAGLTPLCHLLDLDDRVVALCVPGPGREPHVLELELDKSELVARGSEFLWAMTSFPQQVGAAAFGEIVERTARWLWDAVMGALVEAHREAGALAIVPWGRLALLPLQAAWTEDDDADSGRRYAIDELCLSFPVSAARLVDADRRAAAVGPPTALVVEWAGDQASALRWVPAECAAALNAFPPERRTHLRAATRGEVHDHVAGRDVVHFACHGEASLQAPLASALQLADGPLTVGDLLEASLDARLVFLSACETGVVGMHMPEEAIGLGGVLSQLGAAGVIASSWPVPDAATAAIAVHFYELWIEDGLEPADALRRAQARVRDCVGPVGSLSHRVLAAFPDLGDPPLPSFYWAAFAFSGR